MNNYAAITKACFDAYVRKDRSAIELLINDGFSFTNPLDNRIDRKAYFERCWPNSQHIEEFKFIQVVPFEDKVFVVYEGKSSTGDVFRNTEIFTIRKEKIIEVEVYFGWTIPHKAPDNGFVNE
ncbi:MAG: nuclear transport factor 2 family protein [Gammaproteobacteria bacterium]|nr:MAG: nuclear transport factor 2 family protein [Gammaproteobacteria bacterium]